MTVINKIDALVTGITRADMQALRPAQRQHLAQLLRYVADMADPPKGSSEPPKAGFIDELSDGRGRE
jgi:hypothetical protein